MTGLAGSRPPGGEGCLIGLDLGSSTIKGVSLSMGGDILDTASAPMPRSPSADRAIHEIDPEEFIDTVFGVVRRLSPDPERTKGISWVAASGTLLLLDGGGRPLAPMASWLDERPLDGSIEAAFGAEDAASIHEIVGWPLSRQFPFGRLLWLRANKPELLAGASRICTVNDWLGWRLTGAWAIDRSTATTMYVYNQVAGRRHDGILGRLGLAPGLFSEPRETGSLLGRVLPGPGGLCGLKEGTGVWLGSFDHPGAALALDISRKGHMLLSCGTSWVGLGILPDRATGIRARLLVDPYGSGRGGSWCGMVSLMGIGKIVDAWIEAVFERGKRATLRSRIAGAIGPEEKFAAIDRMVAECPVTGRIPVLDLRAMRPDAETVDSLLDAHGAGALFRGIMESAAFEFKDLLAARWPGDDPAREISMVGGPARGSAWRKAVAEVLGGPLTVRFAAHAGAVGAALIAARGAGVAVEPREPGVEILPDPAAVAATGERYERYLEMVHGHAR